MLTTLSPSNKEAELSKAKVDKFKGRLGHDLHKIPVRKRDLENRLELSRGKKEALLRHKDDAILDLKRKLEQTSRNLTVYREKVGELYRGIETNNEQFGQHDHE